jgi:hypothetical protein
MQRGRSPVTLADLLGAGFLHTDQQLSFRRNSAVTAHVTAEGTIQFEGTEYPSPSTAGKAAAGGTSTNGWVSWYVKDGEQWSSLAALRNRHLAPSPPSSGSDR